MTIESLMVVIKEQLGSQSELARRLNVDKSSVSKYVSAERKPSIPVMRHMAEILDLDFMEIVEVFYGSDDRTA